MCQDRITEGIGAEFVLFLCMFPTVVMHLPFVSVFSGNTSQAFSLISNGNKSLLKSASQLAYMG